MDPANVREGILEAAIDETEGADMIMVKPALAYLDVVRAVRERTELPLFAYNVSGEYSMVKAAARLGWLDERRAVLEALTGMRRAGADAIISYHAKDAASVARAKGRRVTDVARSPGPPPPRSGSSPRRSGSCPAASTVRFARSAASAARPVSSPRARAPG